MKSNCEHIRPFLPEYLDKQLPKDQEALVVEHLRHCKDCSTELEQLLAVVGDLRDIPDEQPSDAMRERFYATLGASISEEGKKKANVISFPRGIFRIAASVALLATGLAIGLLIPRGQVAADGEITALRQEVGELQKNVILARLDQQSPSQRILAASSVEESGMADEGVIEALVKTMETDENTNVRMSAMHALFRFRDIPKVREALIDGLEKQTDPVLQITLINMMVEMQEQRAINIMKNIMQRDETIPEVRNYAEKGLESINA